MTPEVWKSLNKDTRYLLEISEAVDTGTFPPVLIDKDPGNITEARWITNAATELRLYCQTNPSELSGDHKKIEEWKLANSLWVTKQKRPDLFKQIQLSEKEMILLRQYEDQINEKINTNG